MTTDESFAAMPKGLVLASTRGDYAFFRDSQTVRSFTEFECNIVKVWQTKQHQFVLASALRKNSQYYTSMNWKFSKFVESGYVDFVKSRYNKGEPNCKPLIRSAKPLSFQKLISAFVALSIGIFASALILILESTCPSMCPSPKKYDPRVDLKHQEAFHKLWPIMKLMPRNLRRIVGEDTLYEAKQLLFTELYAK